MTLSPEALGFVDWLADELEMSRSRVVDLLVVRAGLRGGQLRAADLGTYNRAAQRRLGVWFRATMRQRRRAAEAASQAR